jgi:hypothetical protein
LTAFPITLTSASWPVSLPTLKVTSYKEAVTNLEDALQFLQTGRHYYGKRTFESHFSNAKRLASENEQPIKCH